MSINLYCDTQLLSEKTQYVLNRDFYDFTADDTKILLKTTMYEKQNNKKNYGLLTSIKLPQISDINKFESWYFIEISDEPSIAEIIKYFTQTNVLAREIPLLKTFAIASSPNLSAVNKPREVSEPPCALIFGSETLYGKMASIVPDNFEIIGAYHEGIAEDFLTLRRFNAIIIDKNAVVLENIRLLRIINSHPDFVNIPVFMLGDFTLNEAIIAQKQGVNVVCQQDWPIEILKKAVSHTTYQMINFLMFKSELSYLKLSTIPVKQQLFSPIAQKLFVASLETRLRLSKNGLPRGTALVIDFELFTSSQFTGINEIEIISANSETHYTISKQIFDLIQHLSRCEDQIFAISVTRIAIILPATIAYDAMRVGARFKAILETSKFRPPIPKSDSLTELASHLECSFNVRVKFHTIPIDQESIESKSA